MRYLARQGLAMRRNDPGESNIIQLLKMRSEDNPTLANWLKKNSNTFTSPENQNEMLQKMSHHILRNVLHDIHSSPFLTIMVDETTDKSNKEQLTLIIRWVDQNFVVFEEFMGLYSLHSITAASIVSAILDALLRFEIPLSRIRGQCYDECSTMAGAKSGVAVQIQEKAPKAIFTHCYGHALNLSVNDSIRQSTVMDCLNSHRSVKLC